MKKRFLKKNIAQIIAAVVLVLSISVPVVAATGGVSADEARGSTPYVPYSSLPLYSGVKAYTSSGACTSRQATVSMERVTYNGSASTTSIGVATYATADSHLIGNETNVSAGARVDISNASIYPGQSIKAGFVKNNFNGTYYLSGKFYYNGL